MIAKVVWIIGLILDFVAFAVLREDRNKKWHYYVWLAFIVIAAAGSLLLLYAVLAASNVPNDAAGGFAGLGLLMLVFVCLPYLVLLLLCLKYRPQRGKNADEKGEA